MRYLKTGEEQWQFLLKYCSTANWSRDEGVKINFFHADQPQSQNGEESKALHVEVVYTQTNRQTNTYSKLIVSKLKSFHKIKPDVS